MKIFVTGATGFLGRAVLARLLARPDLDGTLLVRSPASLPPLPQGWDHVTGDLSDPARYETALQDVDCVLHMAAITGKAAPKTYAALNRDATEALARAAQKAGARHLVFVSSIAAGYGDTRHYPYAVTKLEAEQALARTGLPHSILRPTLIFGPGSPIADTLGKIAGAPIIPLPGRGAPAEVQPVHVDDVAKAIERLVDHQTPAGDVLDFGGPERLSFREFLARMHTEITGKSARFLPFPLTPLQLILAAMEPLARPVMPATAGQFAVFANSSAAEDNWLMAALRPDMIGIEAMLAEAVSGDPPAPPAPPKDAERRAVPSEPDETLMQECRDFSRYLCGEAPGAKAEDAYLRGVAHFGLTPAPDSFEASVLRFARKSPFCLRLMDGYASTFARTGLFRQRLVLLLAILEKLPPTTRRYHTIPQEGPWRAVAALGVQGVAGVALSLLGGLTALGLAASARFGSRPA